MKTKIFSKSLILCGVLLFTGCVKDAQYAINNKVPRLVGSDNISFDEKSVTPKSLEESKLALNQFNDKLGANCALSSQLSPAGVRCEVSLNEKSYEAFSTLCESEFKGKWVAFSIHFNGAKRNGIKLTNKDNAPYFGGYCVDSNNQLLWNMQRKEKLPAGAQGGFIIEQGASSEGFIQSGSEYHQIPGYKAVEKERLEAERKTLAIEQKKRQEIIEVENKIRAEKEQSEKARAETEKKKTEQDRKEKQAQKAKQDQLKMFD